MIILVLIYQRKKKLKQKIKKYINLKPIMERFKRNNRIDKSIN